MSASDQPCSDKHNGHKFRRQLSSDIRAWRRAPEEGQPSAAIMIDLPVEPDTSRSRADNAGRRRRNGRGRPRASRAGQEPLARTTARRARNGRPAQARAQAAALSSRRDGDGHLRSTLLTATVLPVCGELMIRMASEIVLGIGCLALLRR